MELHFVRADSDNGSGSGSISVLNAESLRVVTDLGETFDFRPGGEIVFSRSEVDGSILLSDIMEGARQAVKAISLVLEALVVAKIIPPAQK